MFFPAATIALLSHLTPPPSLPMSFDFKDPKGIGAVSLKIDSVMEPIVGYAKGISGTISFDPQNPASARGSIFVDVSTIQFANDGYTATAKNFALDQKKFPQLELKIVKILSWKRLANGHLSGTILADFICRGITRQKRMVIDANYLPGKAEERTNGTFKGDLLVIRTGFTVDRAEHGISEGIPDDLVSRTITVDVAVVGISYSAGAK